MERALDMRDLLGMQTDQSLSSTCFFVLLRSVDSWLVAKLGQLLSLGLVFYTLASTGTEVVVMGVPWSYGLIVFKQIN
jgi:hypothetical protein